VVAAGHHGGAWKVAYADFVTAMMAFFLLLWLLGATTEKQRKGWPITSPRRWSNEAGKRRIQRDAGRFSRSPMSTIIPTAPARPGPRR
jgi:flagellar motor protein MotB